MDDGVGPAPYGQQIFLTPWTFQRYPGYSGQIVFGGYCDSLDYEWINGHEVKISCTTNEPKKAIVRQREKYGDVIIHYDIKRAVTPHN